MLSDELKILLSIKTDNTLKIRSADAFLSSEVFITHGEKYSFSKFKYSLEKLKQSLESLKNVRNSVRECRPSTLYSILLVNKQNSQKKIGERVFPIFQDLDFGVSL